MNDIPDEAVEALRAVARETPQTETFYDELLAALSAPTIIQHTGPTPYKRRATDAGWDLRALTSTTLKPGRPTPITLATKINLPPGTHATLTARSSLATQGVLTHQGTIDTGYTGPLKLIATNMADHAVHIRADERVAQLIIHPTNTNVEWEWVDALPQTSRGEHGFGSTGRH